MVRIASIVLLLLITSLSYGNNARLRVTANSTTIEIGKPLLLNISAYNIDKNITSINMDILLKNFGFQVIESSRKLNKNKDAIQELKISLYPHYTGEFKIPSLELGGYRSAPLAVTILPALEKNKTLSFNSTISSLSSWQRQQVIMTISVLTHSKFARIKLDDLSYNEIESYT